MPMCTKSLLKGECLSLHKRNDGHYRALYLLCTVCIILAKNYV
jgi:hypothetical protein